MAKAAPKLGPEINIDLLPSQGSGGSLGNAIAWLLSIGRYLIIFTEVVAIGIFITSIYLSSEKNSLRAQVNSLSEQVEQQSSFEKNFRQITSKISQIKTLSETQVLTSKIFEEFLNLLPEGVALETLNMEDKSIAFEGTFDSASQLQTLVSSFSKSQTLVGLTLTKLAAPNEKTPKFTFAGTLQVIEKDFLRGNKN